MSKQTKATNDKLTKLKPSNLRRRLRLADLVPTALSAAVLIGALASTKRPPGSGD